MNKILVLLALSLTVIACKDNDDAGAAKAVEVEVVKPLIKDVDLDQEFVGQIYGKVDIPIRARVSGFLQGIHFKEGGVVEKDQLLYTIDPQPYEAEVAAQKSRLAEAKTELVRSENELIRYEELIKTKAVSQSDYDATKAEAEAAKAAMDAANANVEMAEINLGYCKMYAPINGVIGRSEAKEGEFVGKDPNPVILNTVSHVQDVRVIFFLTERQYLTLAREYDVLRHEGEPDTTRDNLELILTDGSIHDYKGHVDFINREVDATTGSILVQASFPNPRRILRPGQFSKVRVKFDVIENAILVPQRSLQELQGKHSIRLLSDSNTVVTKQVTISGRKGAYAVISEGVKPTDKIIFSAGGVPPGVTVNAKEVEFKGVTE